MSKRTHFVTATFLFPVKDGIISDTIERNFYPRKNYGNMNLPSYYQFYYVRQPSCAMLCRIMDDLSKTFLRGKNALNRHFKA